MGWILLLGMAPVGWLLARNSPESCGLMMDNERPSAAMNDETHDFTLSAALHSPAFWVFALASSAYGLIAAGISLFNESILLERGFDKQVFYDVAQISTGTALVSNFLGGWLATRWSISRLMAAAMLILSTALFALPQVSSYRQAVGYALGMGAAGGIVTVVFFTIWSRAFGRTHLGRIQGAAQMLTVFASALGPLLLAECQSRTGSYTLMFYSLACVVAGLAVAAWYVPVPGEELRIENSEEKRARKTRPERGSSRIRKDLSEELPPAQIRDPSASSAFCLPF
jgi:MFS family permease